MRRTASGIERLSLSCSQQGDVDCATESIVVSKAAPFFRGHFDNFAVFPAVAQLDTLLLDLCEEVFETLGQFTEAKRLKFLRPIAPGDVLRVEVRRVTLERISFSITRDEETVSSGVLEFKA